jgi:hypothetical protein
MHTGNQSTFGDAELVLGAGAQTGAGPEVAARQFSWGATEAETIWKALEGGAQAPTEGGSAR